MTEIAKRVVAVDAVIFNGRGDLLLIERTDNRGWALPGGVVEEDETVEEAVVREVQEETQAIWPANFQLRMFRIFSAPGRDPRGPTISVAFLGVIADTVHVRGGDDARKAEWVHDWEKRRLAFDHAEIARIGWEQTGIIRGPLPSEQPLPEILPDITFKQRQYLKDLYGGLGAHRPANNTTLQALQKKGCAKCQTMMEAGKELPHWTITELGRAVISG